MLTCAQEDDRAFSRSYSTKRTTTLRMTVKLGNDDRTDAYGLLERFSLGEARLTDAAIHDEDTCVR